MFIVLGFFVGTLENGSRSIVLWQEEEESRDGWVPIVAW
jgi:hypothetical protein